MKNFVERMPAEFDEFCRSLVDFFKMIKEAREKNCLDELNQEGFSGHTLEKEYQTNKMVREMQVRRFRTLPHVR